MAEVTGSIGDQPVELTNAATEATLRQLLQATIASATKNTSALAALAKSSGLNADTIKQANDAVKDLSPQMNLLGRASFMLGATFAQTETKLKTLWGTTESLAAGTAQASGVLTSMATMLPPVLSHVTLGLAKLAQFQEGMMKQYQTLSTAGVNFGGSLTELRLAASQTYMTMDQFTKLASANGEAFSKMGGTADQGARAFVKASNDLLRSEAGTKLRALGFTTEEINQSMLNYISITGGRSRREMQDTEALSKSTTLYLQELDQLAAITGKSRAEAEKKVKAEMQEAEFQLFLASKSKEERELIEQNVKRFTTIYGQGGADIAKANAMGVAVQGEAGKKLTALSGGAAESIRNDLELRRKYGPQSEQVIQNEIAGRQANARDLGRLAGPVGSFSGVLKGNEDAVRQAAKDRVAGEQEVAEQYSQAARERTARENSQAEAAVRVQKSLEELGQKLLAAFMPVIEQGLKVANALAPMAPYLMGLATVIGLTVAAIKSYNLVVAMKTALSKGTLGKPLGSTTLNPLYTSNVPGAPGAPASTGTAAGPGGKKGIGSKLASGLKGGIGGIAGGLLLGAAADMAKEKGMEKTGAGLDIAGSAASFAGTGALLGSIVPGVGTAIGGALGGLAGGAYGLYKNWDTLSAGIGGDKSKSASVMEEETSKSTSNSNTLAGKMENVSTELDKLNKNVNSMVGVLKEVAENTKRTVDATKSLNRDLFP